MPVQHARRLAAPVVVVALGAALPSTAVAAPKPSAPVAPKTAEPGARLDVKVPVRGKGKVKVALLLSKDERADRKDRVLARSTVRVRKKSTTARLRPRLASSVTPGRYRLLGCVERRRGTFSACKVAKGALRVARPAGVPKLPAPAAPAPAPGPAAPAAPAPSLEQDAPPRPPIPTSLPGITPNPRSVVAKPDAARAASTTASRSAATTLTATGADGTKYKLEVPAGALLSDTPITMTPLSGVDGLPLSGGLVAGVQFAPEGLRLLKPARLTITDHPAVADAARTAFSYHGAGEDFHLIPAVAGGGLALDVWHFSGAGFGSGTDADRAAQAGHAPSRPFDQAQQEAARMAREGDVEDLIRLHKDYYQAVIRPQLLGAMDDDALANKALVDAFGFLGAAQILLGEDTFAAEKAEILELGRKVSARAFDRAARRCIVERQLQEAATILGISRQHQFYFGDELGGQETVDRCVRFEVDWEVSGFRRFTGGGGYIDTETVHVKDTAVPVRMAGPSLEPAPLPLSVVTWSKTGTHDCSATGTELEYPGSVKPVLDPVVTETKRDDGTIEVRYGPPSLRVVVQFGDVRTLAVCDGTTYDTSLFSQLLHHLWSDLLPDPAWEILEFTDFSRADDGAWVKHVAREKVDALGTLTRTHSGTIKLTVRHTPGA